MSLSRARAALLVPVCVLLLCASARAQGVTGANEAPEEESMVAAERGRPRAATPFAWEASLAAARRKAAESGRRVVIAFSASWCGPCALMDEWVWTDAEVGTLLNQRYAGFMADGDAETALVERFRVIGYPTVVVLDASGTELFRFVGYRSSKEVIRLLSARPSARPRRPAR